MIYFRLGSAGAPRQKILLLLAEIWGSFVLAVAVLVALASLTGSGEMGQESEVADFLARWRQLSSGAQALLGAGLAVAAGVLVFALLSIRQAMRQHPLE